VGARVVLDPAQLSLEPGGEAVCHVRIRNDGAIVDEFSARVVGAAADWTLIEAESVRLFPGNDGEVALRFRPPRTWKLAPGPLPFGVRVVATSAGPQSALVEEGTLEIGPFRDLDARITPRTSRARLAGRHRVVLVNHGNIPAVGRLTGTDPDEQLSVRFRQQRFEVPPGASRRIRTKVRPATVSMGPSKEPHPFEVTVTPEGEEPVKLAAAMVLRPVVPVWLPVLLIAAVLLVGILVAIAKRNTLESRATNGPVGGVAAAATVGGAAKAGAAGGGAAGGAAAGGGAAAAGGPAGGAASPAARPAPAASVSPVADVNCLAGQPLPGGSFYAADGSAADSGAQNDATLQAGAVYEAGSVGGDADQAFSFPVPKASVDAGGKVGQLGISDFCVSLQVKTSQHTAGPLVGNADGAPKGHSWSIGIGAGGLPSVELDDTTGATPQRLRLDALTAINDGKWHALAAIRRGRLLNLYVDRGLAASTSAAVIDISSGTDTRFGSDTVTGFTGALDDLLIVAG
jgi:hypothetical protein